jgi:hypothetical protein
MSIAPMTVRERPGRPDPVGHSSLTVAPSWYRIADGVLGLASDYAPLVDAFDQRYGECGVPGPAPSAPTVRCDATLLPGSSLLLLRFAGDAVRHAVSFALGFFQPVRGWACFTEAQSLVPGWRLVVNREHGGRVVVASDGESALVDVDECPLDLVLDYLISAVQGVQPDVFLLHGGSFAVGGRGGLLIGPSKSGKSTVSFSLGLRGHTFLGDDIAAVRLSTRELMPVRRAVGIRTGPLASQLEGRIQTTRHVVDVAPSGELRTYVRAEDLLPAGSISPVPLRAVLFLDGFAEQPRVTPYEVRLSDLDRVRSAALFWEPAPGRQLMNFMAIIDLLSSVPCYLLQPASPTETVEAIERVMEGL